MSKWNPLQPKVINDKAIDYHSWKDARKLFHVKALLKPVDKSLYYDASKKVQNWRYYVVVWWNSWVNGGWSHKKKQLYLHGPSNTGKTTFINHVLLGKFFMIVGG